jgi:bud emergence protein 1
MKALVPRYCFADDIFWFIVEAEMEDGRHWELSRLYQDFYDLQIALIQEYPLEAGNVKNVERSLPYMPGPVTYVTDNISNGRRANLDEYIRNLLKLGPHITRGFLVRTFFAPREGDYEIDPEANDSYRLSGTSQDAAAGKANGQATRETHQKQDNYSQSQGGYPPGSQQQRSQQGHFRGQSGATSPPPLSNPYGQPTPGNQNPPPALIKIKVWFGQDNCVVIRMPPGFNFADLYKKLQERRQLEQGLKDDTDELEVCYRDEQEGTLYRIQGDADLGVAMERNAKLTLNIRSLGP